MPWVFHSHNAGIRGDLTRCYVSIVMCDSEEQWYHESLLGK